MSPSSEHLAGAEGAATIETPGLKSITLAVNSLYATGGIIVVNGEPGVGKTFGTRHTLDALKDKPLYWADMPENPKGKEATAYIYSAVTGSRPGSRMTQYELTEETCDVLDGLQAVLVIDESQNMTPRALKQLRYLHDRPSTQVLLVLLGDGVSKAVSKVPALASRVARTVEIKGLNPTEVKALLPQLHPLFANTPIEVLSDLSLWAGGNLRRWMRIVEVAQSLKVKSESGLTSKQARLVLYTITGVEPK